MHSDFGCFQVLFIKGIVFLFDFGLDFELHLSIFVLGFALEVIRFLVLSFLGLINSGFCWVVSSFESSFNFSSFLLRWVFESL